MSSMIGVFCFESTWTNWSDDEMAAEVKNLVALAGTGARSSQRASSAASSWKPTAWRLASCSSRSKGLTSNDETSSSRPSNHISVERLAQEDGTYSAKD